MDIVPIYKRVIGLDVHQAQITGCAITEQPDDSVMYERREFGGFKRDLKALAEWARAIDPDVVVMESTGTAKALTHYKGFPIRPAHYLIKSY